MLKRSVVYFMSLFLFFSMGASSLLFADTITLKSGQKIEGKIIERGAESTKMEVEGITLTYWNSQIEDGAGDKGPAVPQAAVASPSVTPDIEKYSSELRSSYKDGQYEEALAAAQNLIRLDPGSADFNFYLAIAHARLGHYDEAAASLEKALSFKQEDPGWYACLGIIYDSLGKKKEAGEMLLKAKEKYLADGELLTDIMVASFFVDSYRRKTEG